MVRNLRLFWQAFCLHYDYGTRAYLFLALTLGLTFTVEPALLCALYEIDLEQRNLLLMFVVVGLFFLTIVFSCANSVRRKLAKDSTHASSECPPEKLTNDERHAHARFYGAMLCLAVIASLILADLVVSAKTPSPAVAIAMVFLEILALTLVSFC